MLRAGWTKDVKRVRGASGPRPDKPADRSRTTGPRRQDPAPAASRPCRNPPEARPARQRTGPERGRSILPAGRRDRRAVRPAAAALPEVHKTADGPRGRPAAARGGPRDRRPASPPGRSAGRSARTRSSGACALYDAADEERAAVRAVRAGGAVPGARLARTSCSASSSTRRGAKPGTTYPIGEYELASRLSYFLWNSMPDDELFALAGEGPVAAEPGVQVRRMLQDPQVALVRAELRRAVADAAEAGPVVARPEAVPERSTTTCGRR